MSRLCLKLKALQILVRHFSNDIHRNKKTTIYVLLHSLLRINDRDHILLCRVGLFTPDMAFEVIVKNQIRKLTDPSIKCIDMVMTELLDMIKQCGILVCEMCYCTLMF